jgi:hypothetical protein
MIRTLAMIAIAGFFVAVLSLSGAAALGGYDIKKHGWSFPVQWDWDDDDDDGDRGDLRRIDWNTPETTRTIEWAGADRVEIAIPADVTFTQAATPSLVVTGPRDAVEHVVVEGGRIGFSGRGEVQVNVRGMNVDVRGLEGFKRLKIQMAAPDVRAFRARAASNLTLVGVKRSDLEIEAHAASHVLGDIDVDRLRMQLHSAADANLDGRADDLDLEVHSAADARLDRLAIKNARVEAHSAADAALAPTDSADVDAHSGADVVLRSRPAQLSTETHSGGDIRFTGPVAITTPPATNAPAPPVSPAVPAAPATPPAPKAPAAPKRT